jgi:uroporphyrin-III C-methyltransferase
MHPNATLSLVGAGPGDPDLITMKAVKVLASADVVLYDALVDESLLDYAPASALKLFVGKKKGVCQFPQEEIHRLIIQYCTSHGHVVRLKGGDPFIFGRGHEELLVAKQHGIPVCIVPGVSSSIAVPALQEIPLTRRGINDSFWVLTGTTRDHQLSRDIYHAAQSDLDHICEVFGKFGKSHIPVAVIQNGSRSDERFVLGCVRDIAAKVKAAGICSPAVIVVGEVVNLHPSLWKDKTMQVVLEQ